MALSWMTQPFPGQNTHPQVPFHTYLQSLGTLPRRPRHPSQTF